MWKSDVSECLGALREHCPASVALLPCAGRITSGQVVRSFTPPTQAPQSSVLRWTWIRAHTRAWGSFRGTPTPQAQQKKKRERDITTTNESVGPQSHPKTDRRASVAGAFPHGGSLRCQKKERKRERQRAREQTRPLSGRTTAFPVCLKFQEGHGEPESNPAQYFGSCPNST